MNTEKDYNLKHHAIGFSVAFSVLLFSYLDKYVYDLHTLVGALLAGCCAYLLGKFFERLPFLDKEINKKTQNALTVLALFAIFFAFSFFEL